MIKKVGNILIVMVLLLATGGIPITRHYCGPVKMSFSIYATPKPCCDSHCNKCHNVFTLSKINDDFEAGQSISIKLLTKVITLHSAIFIDLLYNILYSSSPDLINQRKFFLAEADHSPASLGNFRC